jgi:hypothetical protein
MRAGRHTPEPDSRPSIAAQEKASRASGSGLRWRSRLTGGQVQAPKVLMNAQDKMQPLAKGPEGAFCVKDEYDIDMQGDKHPAHAHIGSCECAFPVRDRESETFLQVFKDLVNLFKQHAVHP